MVITQVFQAQSVHLPASHDPKVDNDRRTARHGPVVLDEFVIEVENCSPVELAAEATAAEGVLHLQVCEDQVDYRDWE